MPPKQPQQKLSPTLWKDGAASHSLSLRETLKYIIYSISSEAKDTSNERRRRYPSCFLSAGDISPTLTHYVPGSQAAARQERPGMRQSFQRLSPVTHFLQSGPAPSSHSASNSSLKNSVTPEHREPCHLSVPPAGTEAFSAGAANTSHLSCNRPNELESV